MSRPFAAAMLVAVSACPALLAQSSPIHVEIQTVYSFQPHLLTPKQIAAKSVILDGFWEKAKSDQQRYGPGLREELSDYANPPFFLYDGSLLLLSLSDTEQDRKIALAAMARCDLRALVLNDYFARVHHLAALHEDTSAAAFHIWTSQTSRFLSLSML